MSFMVVTIVEGRVDPDRMSDLAEAFSQGSGNLPPAIVESFLLRPEDGDAWRIVSVWRSREELDAYRASVETPGAFAIFRAAGVEPTLTIFEVAEHATHEGNAERHV
jgi:heme-degrading monooxygenase HmoA